MFCQSCGKEMPDAASACLHCGLSTVEGLPSVAPSGAPEGLPSVAPSGASGQPDSNAAPPAPSPAAALPQRQTLYAGFWLRAVAIIIDSVLYSIVAMVVIVVFIFLMIDSDFISPSDEAMIVGTVVVIEIFFYLGWFLYFAILESSEWQASIGKKIVGLTVTDLRGTRLSFARAAGRSFGAMISHMTFGVGYVMAGFTQKKQALHDMIADCLVLRAR